MNTLPGYQIFLENKNLVDGKKLSYYFHWVSSFITYCRQQECSPAEDSRIAPFLSQLAKSKEDWQVNQAREALRLYHYYLAQEKQANIPAHSGNDAAVCV